LSKYLSFCSFDFKREQNAAREARKVDAKHILLEARRLSRSKISESASSEIETVRESLFVQRQIVDCIVYCVYDTEHP